MIRMNLGPSKTETAASECCASETIYVDLGDKARKCTTLEMFGELLREGFSNCWLNPPDLNFNTIVHVIVTHFADVPVELWKYYFEDPKIQHVKVGFSEMANRYLATEIDGVPGVPWGKMLFVVQQSIKRLFFSAVTFPTMQILFNKLYNAKYEVVNPDMRIVVLGAGLGKLTANPLVHEEHFAKYPVEIPTYLLDRYVGAKNSLIGV